MSNTDIFTPSIVNVLFKLNKIIQVCKGDFYYKHQVLKVTANDLQSGSLSNLITILKNLYGSSMTTCEINDTYAILKYNNIYIGINTEIIDNTVKILYGCYATLENLKNWFANDCNSIESTTEETDESSEDCSSDCEEETDDSSSNSEEETDDSDDDNDEEKTDDYCEIDCETHIYDKYRYLHSHGKKITLEKIIDSVKARYENIKILSKTDNNIVLFKTIDNIYICVNINEVNSLKKKDTYMLTLVEKIAKNIIILFEMDYDIDVPVPIDDNNDDINNNIDVLNNYRASIQSLLDDL